MYSVKSFVNRTGCYGGVKSLCTGEMRFELEKSALTFLTNIRAMQPDKYHALYKDRKHWFVSDQELEANQLANH